MSRLALAFARTGEKEESRFFVAYLCAGDPDFDSRLRRVAV